MPSATGTPKKKDLQKVRAFVRDALSDVDWLDASGDRLLGMGGAARNLAAAAQHASGGLDLGVQGRVWSGSVVAPGRRARSAHILLAATPTDRPSAIERASIDPLLQKANSFVSGTTAEPR